MTLIIKLDLDMVKMYLHTKNEVSMSRGSKVIVWTDRNTDTHTQTDMTENITYPHTRVVKKHNTRSLTAESPPHYILIFEYLFQYWHVSYPSIIRPPILSGRFLQSGFTHVLIRCEEDEPSGAPSQTTRSAWSPSKCPIICCAVDTWRRDRAKPVFNKKAFQ